MKRPLVLSVCVLLFVALWPAVSSAQSNQELAEAHRSLMAKLGKSETYNSLRALADESDARGRIVPEVWDRFAAQRTTWLVLQGYDVERVQELRHHGIDVVEAALEDRGRRTLADDVALSDLVVIGHVADCAYDESLNDGFNASIRIQVERSLRGRAPQGSVILRQFGGVLDRSGGMHIGTNIIICEEESKGLFFLSNALYRYYASAALEGELVPTSLHTRSIFHRFNNRGDPVWASDPTHQSTIIEVERLAEIIE